MTAKEMVLKRWPKAYRCHCGCGGIMFKGRFLGKGSNPRAAWASAASKLKRPTRETANP